MQVVSLVSHIGCTTEASVVHIIYLTYVFFKKLCALAYAVSILITIEKNKAVSSRALQKNDKLYELKFPQMTVSILSTSTSGCTTNIFLKIHTLHKGATLKLHDYNIQNT